MTPIDKDEIKNRVLSENTAQGILNHLRGSRIEPCAHAREMDLGVAYKTPVMLPQMTIHTSSPQFRHGGDELILSAQWWWVLGG